jgi:NAD-dependent DNA ligase
MNKFFGRQGAAHINEMNQSLGALLGIASGLLADRELRDAEIQFLKEWLDKHSAIAAVWPGDVVHARVSEVLADGKVTSEERDHLIQTLQRLVGGTLDELAASKHVTQLLPYETPLLDYPNATFCLTGDFVLAARGVCEKEIASRGGLVKSSVSKKLRYLLVGGLGSPEWKHGSFGTKIEKAMELKKEGAPIFLIHEDHWATSLRT